MENWIFGAKSSLVLTQYFICNFLFSFFFLSLYVIELSCLFFFSSFFLPPGFYSFAKFNPKRLSEQDNVIVK